MPPRGLFAADFDVADINVSISGWDVLCFDEIKPSEVVVEPFVLSWEVELAAKPGVGALRKFCRSDAGFGSCKTGCDLDLRLPWQLKSALP